MDYCISAPTKTDWRMSPAVFTEKLVARWPNAHITRITDPSRKTFSHEWRIRMPKGNLEGMYNQIQSGVVLNGDLGDCAAFALWFRSIVSDQQPLVFYDDAYNVHVALASTTSTSDIAAAFAVT